MAQLSKVNLTEFELTFCCITILVSACESSALPSLDNADVISADIPVGQIATYTCKPGFRLAPDTPTSNATEQNVICQADGTFTALAFTCVCK